MTMALRNRDLDRLLGAASDNDWSMTNSEVDAAIDRIMNFKGTARSKPVRDTRTPEERARDQRRAINENLKKLAAKRALKPQRVR
jgi:hypothetical protein